MQALIELRNVRFGYGAKLVLDEINLHLHAGQFAALVGPSGAGKTTLLKLILGTLKPTRGEICIDGCVGRFIAPTARGLCATTGNGGLEFSR